MSVIRSVRGRQVLDSRGRPTVEVEVGTDDGVVARASVPSGASTGTHEAHELRDGDRAFFDGLGVLSAVAHVNGEIAAALRGHDVADQQGCDRVLRELDGTPGLSRLGANAVLGASLATCRASAKVLRQPLFRRIADLAGAEPTLPMPMVNIFSGGLHAGRGMDVQDFLAVPISASTMLDAIRLTADVRDAATAVCAERGLPTLLADEGGLSPGCRTGLGALELLVAAVERAGLKPGVDIAIAIDVAATALYDSVTGVYPLRREERRASTADMIDMMSGWVDDYPIVSIEDALDEDDWAGWRELTAPGPVTGCASSATTCSPPTRSASPRASRADARTAYWSRSIRTAHSAARSTSSGMARSAGYAPVVSARSGETEDDLLADLAVGTAAGQIKVGSLRSGERLAKYNQLIRIAEDASLPFSPLALPMGVTR